MNDKVTLDIVGVMERTASDVERAVKAQQASRAFLLDTRHDGTLVIVDGKIDRVLEPRVKAVARRDTTTRYEDLVAWCEGEAFEGKVGTLKIGLMASQALWPRMRQDDGVSVEHICGLCEPPFLLAAVNAGKLDGSQFIAFLDAAEFRGAIDGADLTALRNGIKTLSSEDSSKVSVVTEGAVTKIVRSMSGGTQPGAPIPSRLAVKVPLARDADAPTFTAQLSVRLEVDDGDVTWTLTLLNATEMHDVLVQWVRATKAQGILTRGWTVLG